jgi:hypothetical protein
VDRAEEIGLDHLAVEIVRRFLEEREEGDARVVDPDVNAAVLLHHLLGQFAHRALIAHIGGDRHAAPAELDAFGRHFAQQLRAAGGDDDPRALAGERMGRRAPNPARRTDDNDNGIPQTARHGRPP